ncbi:MAG: hypothetical protein LBB23_02450 [Rickettsiales bacterium]|nr:hypothetical protein [Rickettsiales bacterium]
MAGCPHRISKRAKPVRNPPLPAKPGEALANIPAVRLRFATARQAAGMTS